LTNSFTLSDEGRSYLHIYMKPSYREWIFSIDHIINPKYKLPMMVEQSIYDIVSKKG